METLEHLGPEHLRAAVVIYRDALRAHQHALNRLNVYPVPDGDTGTNMALTLESVVTELDRCPTEMASTCKAISHGSLMGARGNSGVILSQILRGMASSFRKLGDTSASGRELAHALAAGASAAYEAVMRPVEGTILTVAREAAEAAQAAAKEAKSLADVLEAARLGARDALARTPELLEALAAAGVVDAGGAGFALLIDAFLGVVAGRPLPEPEIADTEMVKSAEMAGPTTTSDAPALGVGAGVGASPDAGREGQGGGVSDLHYEVMYFLDAPDEAIAAFRQAWSDIGDSIVVVGGEGLWNCHIHTDDIGAAIEAGIEHGRPRAIRVTDLTEQVEEEAWVREATATPGSEASDSTIESAPALATDAAATAVVAVAPGEGIGQILRSLGAARVVTGGQTLNPSTAELLEAVEAAPADEVVILPNNTNVVPVAEQVDAHTAKRVRVVPTRAVPEGLAALLAYTPHAPLDENHSAMAAAATGVISAEVTRAVRDARSSEAGPITAGDWLGLTADGIQVVATDVTKACIGLLETVVSDDHEIVTIVEGDEADPTVTQGVVEWLAQRRPQVTTEVHHGGQVLYPYLFGVE